MSTSIPTNQEPPKKQWERTRLGALLFLFRRHVLIAAFALSLLVHLIVAVGVRQPFAPSQQEVETVHIEHLRTIRIARVPTPPPVTPSPAPTAQPTTSAAPHRKPAPRSAPAGRGPGRALPALRASSAPTPAPTPHPVATPTCGGDIGATVVAKPSPPADIAASVRGQGTSGTTRVRVTLDANGNVKGTSIAQSSGNDALDFVAMTMARDARYAPATHGCKAVASDYVFSAKFVAW